MTTVVLDNPNARIISIFSDSDVIVGSIRVKPGNDHVYKYQKDDGKEYTISETLDNGDAKICVAIVCNIACVFLLLRSILLPT